jgi:hypothetical protein
VKNLLAAVLACLGLTGCLGYHIGPVKPQYLSDVHSIAIPTFENKTLLPRIEVLVTDTVIKQFQQDGTFRIANSGADATLKGEIIRITSEFNLAVRLKYKLVGPDGKQLGPPGEVTGTTSFFVGTDVTTDERQALPLATEELAKRLVTQLSEGW